ncbi:protein kinase domain containing protein [Stylonychia lemnae]|uniref:Protein kinase domain containing protein n=1 Tax=Stylonychia lemnae TaxID=5949 RepID=A0A078AXW7_STYLE|nr:protein kinase domain containing protein [Stylonychia lemnae]|eukprot:CDW87290.1 protein kinase domain containing protein [Stylonychia lemnae]
MAWNRNEVFLEHKANGVSEEAATKTQELMFELTLQLLFWQKYLKEENQSRQTWKETITRSMEMEISLRILRMGSQASCCNCKQEEQNQAGSLNFEKGGNNSINNLNNAPVQNSKLPQKRQSTKPFAYNKVETGDDIVSKHIKLLATTEEKSQRNGKVQVEQFTCNEPVQERFELSRRGTKTKMDQQQQHQQEFSYIQSRNQNPQLSEEQQPQILQKNNTFQKNEKSLEEIPQNQHIGGMINFQSNVVFAKANTEMLHKAFMAVSNNMNPRILDPNWLQTFEIQKLQKKEIFSEVYEIKMLTGNKDKRLLRKIKKVVFNKNQSGIEDFRFSLEELLLLDHPNIAQLFDYKEDLFNFYLMIEFCEGGKLFDKIEQLEQISENLAAEICRQILSTIVYLHSKSQVYRNLSPEVLYLEVEEELKGESFNLKVIDMDLQQAHALSNTQTYSVPLYFLSPESLNQKVINEKLDVWACGVILLILLTGIPPQQSFGMNPTIIIKNLYQGEIDYQHPSYSDLQTNALEFMQKLLNPDHEKRIKAVTALNDKWLLNLTRSRRSISKKYLKPDMANDVKRFIAEIQFYQKVSLLVQAINMLNDEERLLNTVFNERDIKNQSYLKFEIVKSMYLDYLGEIKNNVEVEKIFRDCPKRSDNNVSYSEFTSFINKQCLETKKQELRDSFQKYDLIRLQTSKEFRKGIMNHSEVNRMLAVVLTCNNQCESFIHEYDRDQDGNLTIEEVIDLVVHIAENQVQI